jgi:surface protein
MTAMFDGCRSLTTVPLFDTSKATQLTYLLRDCSSLTTVPLLDASKVTDMSYMFSGCSSLTECYLRNIKVNLQVGSGTYWGHLLTLDSLIHLIKECRDTGSTKTLTVGSANLNKLANVYVRTIPITDEMRAEDDLIDEKLPFEVCESTDANAMLITNYALEKNWTIK